MPLEVVTSIRSFLVNVDDVFSLRHPGIYQFSGPPKVGKTTLVLWAAGKIAAQHNMPVFVYDTEGQDPETLYSIASGEGEREITLFYIRAPENDSEGLDKLLEESKARVGENPFILVFDSLAGVLPPREANQAIGAANMGARASLISSMMKRFMRLPVLVLATNHEYPSLGNYGKVTPGGEAKKYYTQAHFSVNITYNPKNLQRATIVSGWARWEKGQDAAWVLEVDTVTNRYPGQIKTNYPLLAIRGGRGVDTYLTRLFSLIRSGVLVIRNGVVYEQTGESLGRLSSILFEPDVIEELVGRYFSAAVHSP